MNNNNWMNILWLMLPSECSRIQTTVCFRDNKRSRNPNCSNLPLRFILDYSKLCTSNTLTWTFNLCKLSWLCNKKRMEKKKMSAYDRICRFWGLWKTRLVKSLVDVLMNCTSRQPQSAGLSFMFFHISIFSRSGTENQEKVKDVFAFLFSLQSVWMCAAGEPGVTRCLKRRCLTLIR